MTFDEHQQAVQALSHQLAQQLDGKPHGVILDALASMYVTTAIHFPCCTETAAQNCQHMGAVLNARAALQRPSNAALH